MPKEHQLIQDPIQPISCHAWNKDRTYICAAPNSNIAYIFRRDGDKFVKVHTLDEHMQRITSMDWAFNSDKIVTCGADRNAYVWERRERTAGEKDQIKSEVKNPDPETLNYIWVPQLVILRINRAATCVKFSPNEDKFAVGSGARVVSVCYFEEDSEWWVSKHIKKPIRSTVLSLDWHPNNTLLAVGSSDFKARVFGAAIKGVDKKPGSTCWGAKAKFGECYAEFGTGTVGGGWIHDVSFSADGNQLAYVAHDSSIYVVDGPNEQSVARYVSKHLPYSTVQWITPGTFVVAGHDYMPYLFTYASGNIEYVGEVDAREEKKTTSKFSALDKFRNLDSRGTEEKVAAVKSAHQNAIVELKLFEGDAGSATKFSTVGVDGKLVIWDMDEVSKRLSVA